MGNGITASDHQLESFKFAQFLAPDCLGLEKGTWQQFPSDF